MIGQIFTHSGIYFFGSLISKAVTTITWILLAKVLIPENYGLFTLYFMILQFITFIGDFGLNQYYLKNVETYSRSTLFNKILFVRTLTLIISTIFIFLTFYIFKIFTVPIIFIFLLSMIPMAYLSILDGYYLEQNKGFRVSLKLGSIGAVCLIGYIFFRQYLDTFNVLILLLIALIFTLTWMAPWRKIKFVKVPKTEFFFILKDSSSYAYLTLTSFFYNRGDSFLISYLKGNTSLGIYGLAYRFLESLSLFPSSLIQILFPISAKKSGITKNQLKKISLIMLLFGLLLGVLVFYISPILISSFFHPDYFEAISVLRIFSIVITLFFINSPLATVVQSSDLVKSFLPFGIGNTLLNIILNLIFIPVYGIHAAAWIMVFTEITGLFINVIFVNKLYKSTTSIN